LTSPEMEPDVCAGVGQQNKASTAIDRMRVLGALIISILLSNDRDR
jgi:hypothetical protein